MENSFLSVFIGLSFLVLLYTFYMIVKNKD